MKHGETIVDMQIRFTHLINRLNVLDIPVASEIAIMKILICRTRE